jgi:hypothetical protein
MAIFPKLPAEIVAGRKAKEIKGWLDELAKKASQN